mgnify:CR=1 FL=1
MQNAATALFGLLLLSSAASAQQQVTLRGEIDDLPGSGFVLDDSIVALTSNGASVAAFQGQVVRLTGTWNGSVSQPSVAVQTITPSFENFEFADTPRVGQTFELEIRGQAGQLAFAFVSLGQSFLPAEGGQVVLIDPTQIVASPAGTIPGNGELELSLSVPNSPALIGLDLFGQAGIVSGGSVLTTNPEAVSIQP